MSDEKKKYGILVGKGYGTDWMSILEYRKKMMDVHGEVITDMGVRKRGDAKIVETEFKFGKRLVREVKLKLGTKESFMYYEKYPDHVKPAEVKA